LPDIINVINLPKRTDRLRQFEIQASEQGFNYKIWDGIIDPIIVFRGISASHKRIVMDAKTKRMKRCIVAEDDIKFTSFGAFDYFLSQVPDSMDIFFGSVYEGKINENGRLIKGEAANEILSGMTLYIVDERFYDVFLNINPMNHIDKALGLLADKYEFYVCNPFVAIQANGYSDNKKKECNYDKLLKNRVLYEG
jgi:hypothetical protein